MQEKIFWKLFAKRALIIYFVIIFLFLSCILRVASIATSNYSAVQENQSSLKIKIANLRGTIYDRNMFPITNSRSKIIACISPTPRAITAISNVLSGEELENVLERLKAQKPVTCEVPKEIACDGIVTAKIYTNDPQNTPAIHTIGYTNADNIGVSGIEKAYNDLLYFADSAYIRYACDGKGNILEGIKPEIYNNSTILANGVVTTLDLNIQNIVENESDFIESGAIIVADAKNSKIRAITSRPNFDPNKISDYLNAENSPIFNRTTGAYNVGSIFKPCVAIAGLENNLKDFTNNCTGSFDIIDRTFKCHKHDGHGILDLKYAIVNSCNTYFYNFSFNIGGDKIYKTAKNLNFGSAIKIADGIFTARGNLPETNKLNNIAHLANFSIGQGDFLASPISMLPLYSAIANGGYYYLPSVIESTLKDGKITPYDTGNPTKVMTKSTASVLKESLSLVVTEGTGKSAMPKTTTAAGKTATAQTGKFENGTEICSSWFCGFFPLDNPKYVVIVFSEDSRTKSKSCAEIFAQIADKITALSVDK